MYFCNLGIYIINLIYEFENHRTCKQVPDTRNVGKDAMTAEGTVNRAALPAIFNPEDLNALEQALRLKEQNPGSTVGILTMGPPRAAEIIRQGLYRGADTGWLLTDRLFAGADTLATSYALATAIKRLAEPTSSSADARLSMAIPHRLDLRLLRNWVWLRLHTQRKY